MLAYATPMATQKACWWRGTARALSGGLTVTETLVRARRCTGSCGGGDLTLGFFGGGALFATIIPPPLCVCILPLELQVPFVALAALVLKGWIHPTWLPARYLRSAGAADPTRSALKNGGGKWPSCSEWLSAGPTAVCGTTEKF